MHTYIETYNVGNCVDEVNNKALITIVSGTLCLYYVQLLHGIRRTLRRKFIQPTEN